MKVASLSNRQAKNKMYRIEHFIFCLTINRMAELFGTSKQSISYHLQNIYSDDELNRAATVKEILTVHIELKF